MSKFPKTIHVVDEYDSLIVADLKACDDGDHVTQSLHPVPARRRKRP